MDSCSAISSTTHAVQPLSYRKPTQTFCYRLCVALGNDSMRRSFHVLSHFLKSLSILNPFSPAFFRL